MDEIELYGFFCLRKTLPVSFRWPVSSLRAHSTNYCFIPCVVQLQLQLGIALDNLQHHPAQRGLHNPAFIYFLPRFNYNVGLAQKKNTDYSKT
jgi:hypothetical protein